MRKAILAVSPLMLMLTMGSTDCDAYVDVTVPASDPSAPDTYDGVWWDGSYQKLVSQSASFSYHLAPGERVIAIASGLDNESGVKRIDMYPSVTRRCCFGATCINTNFTKPVISDTQAGTTGSTVKTGVWVGTEVSAAAVVPACPAGYVLTSWSYKWTSVATNYVNKTRTGPTRTISYP